MVNKKKDEELYLSSYREEDYDRLSLAVDILIFTMDDEFRLQILLKKREGYPYKDSYALPGGFVGIKESIEDAALRVMREKVGLKDLHIEQLYTFGESDRDPRMRIVSVAYLCIVPMKKKLKLEQGSEFFRLSTNEGGAVFQRGSDMCETELAFDHSDIIKLALERMRGKLSYTDIGLEFLRDKNDFTIFELQKIYEAIEQRSYDTPNFRRYFKNCYEAENRVEKTCRMSSEYSKRPSSCYRFLGDK